LRLWLSPSFSLLYKVRNFYVNRSFKSKSQKGKKCVENLTLFYHLAKYTIWQFTWKRHFNCIIFLLQIHSNCSSFTAKDDKDNCSGNHTCHLVRRQSSVFSKLCIFNNSSWKLCKWWQKSDLLHGLAWWHLKHKLQWAHVRQSQIISIFTKQNPKPTTCTSMHDFGVFTINFVATLFVWQ